LNYNHATSPFTFLQGETPYNLDMGSAKPILGQMFGTRRINANEDGEVMLGYDLYSSALANILTEPSLAMPVTVGLYAKWGSGKSFLLAKLRDEMKTFTREWIIEPTFDNMPLVFEFFFNIFYQSFSDPAISSDSDSD
jgi:ankyrin repeat-rich membrane spanning protein